MINHEHTISVTNATATINQIYAFCKLRDIDIQKSDCKELVSRILNYETSNELDSDIKQHNVEQKKQNKFDRNGQCKQQKGFMLKNFNSPFQLLKTLNKKPTASVIVGFDEDFQLNEGHQFKQGDYLFCKNKLEALKLIVDWEANATFEYALYDEEDADEVETEGYWVVSLNENPDAYLGNDYCYVSTENLGNDINQREVDRNILEEAIISEFFDLDLPFFFYDRESLNDYLKDWFDEEYGNCFPKKPSEAAYLQYINEYLPCLGLEAIVQTEVGSAECRYLKKLKTLGADFTEPRLMEIAAKTGNIEVCDFLISEGNSIEALTKSKVYGRLNAFYSNAECDNSASYESAKSFYEVAVHFELDINMQDKDKQTVLHHCAQYGIDKLYQLLLSLGANETIKDTAGNTPIDLVELRESKNSDWLSSLFH